MKVKLLGLVIALLAVTSLSFAQAGMCVYDEVYPLTKHCTGGGGIPIDWPVWLMNDQNGNGWVSCLAPDDDPLAPLCDQPPDCDTGPPGTLNRQYMLMGEGTGTAGTFASDPCILATGMYPTYGSFYFKVEYCETTVVAGGDTTCVHCIRWLSRVFQMPTFIDDIFLTTTSDWTCCEWDTCWPNIGPCVPDLYTQFSPVWPMGGPQNFHDCVTLCAGRPHVVSVGPLVKANRVPHGFVLPGCSPTNTPCDSDCYPASGWTFGPLVWTLRMEPDGHAWYDAMILPLTGATDGCACIVVDYIEAADIDESSIAVVPDNNAVRIHWKTLSETGVDAFAIYRDNEPLKTLTATGGTSGAEYNYVDTDVQNGRTYTYDLRSVVGGTGTSFYTASVTPSFENAVVTEYALHQNYPNPFNPSTKIAFDLVDNNPVTLTVYNATGQVVAKLLDGENYMKGRHSITFNSGNLTSGLYFYTVKIGNEFTATKKMLLVK
jgi:hypothetical protein